MPLKSTLKIITFCKITVQIIIIFKLIIAL